MVNAELVPLVKEYLNIESTYTADDMQIDNIISVAIEAVKAYTNGGLDDVILNNLYLTDDLYKPVQFCIIMYAAHLFSNRGVVTFQQAYKLPYTFEFLLNKYIKY